MSISLAIKEFKEKHKINSPSSVKDIARFFSALKEELEKGYINAQIIADFLQKNIASEEKRTRKVTARDFEDFVAAVFGGKVMDNESRKNEISVNLKGVEEFVAAYVASNRREKMDVKFSNFGVSVKTFVPENKEINMGSFAREALFHNFLTLEEYGGERKSGLGSRPQMLKVFNKIKDQGRWKDFCKRFEVMITGIFEDDMLNVVKGGSVMEIYVISGNDFQKLMMERIKKGPESAVSIINRYEGNSIRINRDPVFEHSERINLDFKLLENSKLKEIYKCLAELDRYIFNGLNGKIKKRELQEKMILELTKIIDIIKNTNI